MQELFGQLGDFRRHGGREEQCLAVERDHLADAFNVRNETHVEHAVGFVNDEDFYTGQKQLAAFEMVEQAARRCDEDIDSAFEFAVLIFKRHAANQKGDRQFVVDAIFDEVLFNLRSQFACWLKNECAWHAGAGATAFETGNHGQNEGCGLAGAGLGNAQNVFAFNCVGNGACLDGCGFRVAGFGNSG